LCYRLRSTGEEKWSVVQATPILDEDGQVQFVVSISHDITDRRRAEETMARLASFPELNPNPIVEVDLAGQVHYLNAAAQQLLPGLQAAGPLHPWLADWASIADRFRQGTQSASREVPIGGLWYQQNLYYTEPSRRIRIYGLDITERRQAEEALQESEEKHRILLEESSDPIFTFYPDGQYRYVNKAFADGVGKTREEIIGKKIWDVFPKDEADKRYAAVKWVFENGITKVIEVRVPRPDGDRYYITTVKPILNDQGKVVSVICISKEITERKQAEEALAQHDRAMAALYETSLEINSQPNVPTCCMPLSGGRSSCWDADGRAVSNAAGRSDVGTCGQL